VQLRYIYFVHVLSVCLCSILMYVMCVMYAYVCTCVLLMCMYVCINVCTYVCIFLCEGWMYDVFVRLYVNVCMHVQ
jgi:hypothetical protein